MTQEEQIKQIAEYDGFAIIEDEEEEWFLRRPSHDEFKTIYNDLNGINPVWVKVYEEAMKYRFDIPEKFVFQWDDIHRDYHNALDAGSIAEAFTALAEAITWLKEQKK